MGQHFTNEKAPGLQSEGSKENSTNALNSTGTNPAQLELNLYPGKHKYFRKSTATEAQYERIDRMLSTGEKNTFQFRKAGIMSPATRIKEMNDKLGYYIPTIAQRDIYDEEGYLHKRVGVYELIDRPKAA
jgi:hypothetical protein